MLSNENIILLIIFLVIIIVVVLIVKQKFTKGKGPYDVKFIKPYYDSCETPAVKIGKDMFFASGGKVGRVTEESYGTRLSKSEIPWIDGDHAELIFPADDCLGVLTDKGVKIYKFDDTKSGNDKFQEIGALNFKVELDDNSYLVTENGLIIIDRTDKKVKKVTYEEKILTISKCDDIKYLGSVAKVRDKLRANAHFQHHGRYGYVALYYGKIILLSPSGHYAVINVEDAEDDKIFELDIIIDMVPLIENIYVSPYADIPFSD